MATPNRAVAWWGLMLVIAGVAMAAQMPEDVSDLGETSAAPSAEGGGDATGTDAAADQALQDMEGPAPPPRKLKMKAVDVQGLRLINKYQEFNKKLVGQEGKLRLQLGSPPEELKGLAYTPVKGYKYGYEGRTIEDKSRSECELVCSTYSACKSYSYNKLKRTCIWSTAHMHYDPAFSMWVKTMTPDGHFHSHMFSEIPGMAAIEKLKYPVKGITWEECKYDCAKDESCISFSYSKTRQECLKSGVPIHFADEWTYYEKDIPLADEKKEGHKKEDKEKEKDKKSWIQASTRASRNEMEASTKVTVKLQNARALALDAERSEKAARREMTYHQQKCTLFAGMAMGALKRNMAIMSILTERQLRAVKKKSETEKMNKSVKQQVTKEGLQKAKLEAKIASETSEEAGNKVGDIQKLEKQEKKRRSEGKQRQTKACKRDEVSQAFFQTREAHMKTTEAEAKRIENEKAIATIKEEYKKSAQDTEVKMEAEKKAKRMVEVYKVAVEGQEKRETKAESERDRKFAMDQKEVEQDKLDVASRKEQNAHRVQMLAKEKKYKLKGEKEDLMAQAKKAKKAVEEAEQEAAEKNDARKKKKMEGIRKQKKLEEAHNKKTKEEGDQKERQVKDDKSGVTAAQEKIKQDKLKMDEDKLERAKALAETDRLSAEMKKEQAASAEKMKMLVKKEVDAKKREAEDRAKDIAYQEKQKQALEDMSAAGGKSQVANEAHQAAATSAANAQANLPPPGTPGYATAKAKLAKLEEAAAETAKAAQDAGDDALGVEKKQKQLVVVVKRESCIPICIQGIKDRESTIANEREDKLKTKAAAIKALKMSSPVLLQLSEQDECDPEMPADESGADQSVCRSPVSAYTKQHACADKPKECEMVCGEQLDLLDQQEKNCKQNAAEPAVISTQTEANLESEEGKQLPEAERMMYIEQEKNQKEVLHKKKLAQPVPVEMPVKKRDPFVYKGCEC